MDRNARKERVISRMKTVATFAHGSVRLNGLVLISLGFLFWTGNALSLIPVSLPRSVSECATMILCRDDHGRVISSLYDQGMIKSGEITDA